MPEYYDAWSATKRKRPSSRPAHTDVQGSPYYTSRQQHGQQQAPPQPTPTITTITTPAGEFLAPSLALLPTPSETKNSPRSAQPETHPQSTPNNPTGTSSSHQPKPCIEIPTPNRGQRHANPWRISKALLDSTLYASLTSPGRGCQHDQTAFLKDFDDEEDDGDDDEEDEDNDDGEKGIPDNSHDARKPDPHIFSGVSVIPRVPVMTSLALSPIDRPLPESDSNLVSFQKPSRGEKECTKDQRISEDSSKTNPVAKGDRSTSNNALPLDRRHLQGNRQSLGADVLTKPQASGPIGETHQRTTRPWSHVIWESPKMDTLSLYRSAAPQQDINANETSRGMRKNTPTTTSRPKTVNTTSSADPLQEPSSSTAPSLGKERVSKTVRINIEECKDPPDTRPSSSRYRTGVGGTLLETAPRRPGLERGEAKYKEKRRSISGGPGNILTPMVKRKREFSQSKKHMNRFSLGSGYYASTEPVSLASAIPSSPDARLWQLVRLPARPHSVFIPSSPRTYHGAGSGGIKDNKEPKSQPSGARSSLPPNELISPLGHLFEPWSNQRQQRRRYKSHHLEMKGLTAAGALTGDAGRMIPSPWEHLATMKAHDSSKTFHGIRSTAAAMPLPLLRLGLSQSPRLGQSLTQSAGQSAGELCQYSSDPSPPSTLPGGHLNLDPPPTPSVHITVPEITLIPSLERETRSLSTTGDPTHPQSLSPVPTRSLPALLDSTSCVLPNPAPPFLHGHPNLFSRDDAAVLDETTMDPNYLDIPLPPHLAKDGSDSSSLSASPSSSSRSGRKPRPLSQLQAAFNPRQSLSFLIGSKSDSPVGMYPGSHSSSESLLPKDRRATNSQTSGSSNSVKVIDNRLRKDLNGSYEGNGSSAGSSSSSKALSRNTLPGSLSAKVNGTLTAAAAAVNSITTATTSTWKRNSSMILFPFSLVTYETGGMLGEFKTSTSPCSGSAIICTNKASPLVAPGTVLPPGAVVSTGIPPPATTPSGSLSIASNSPTISTITTTTTKAKRVSGILPPIPAISVTPSSKSSRVLLSASSLSLLAGSMTGLNQRMGDDMVRIKCEDTDEDLDSMASNMDVAGDLVTDEEEQREDEDEGEGEGEEEGRARVKTVEYEAQVAKAGAVDHLPAHGDHPKVLLPQLETMVTLEQPLPDHYNTYEVKIEDEEGLVLQRSHVAVYEINARWGSRLIMLLVTIGGLFCVLGGGNCARHHCRDLQLCPSFGDMWMQQDNADRNLGAWCGPSGLEGAPYMLSVGLSMSVFGIYALVHLQSPISRLVGYSEIDQFCQE